ncbi:alpha/beta hydrolase [Mucilaginibacter angelicae]|uniref:Alpha/beta hydrolase n=1 Tax=Mucilaginibacter angelicae TaxID=869718 RepID=A0ABV6L0F8_9SPHI
MYRHTKQVVTAGVPAEQAKKAIIMLHGRGASASGIISLKDHLELDGFAIYAPQANEHSWYPYSFMAPVENNQPALDSALEVIGELVDDLKQKGIAQEDIYFLGFSQGACLTLEYTGRNAGSYGGIIAFTGGLIGEQLVKENYKGDFSNTPVLITTGDPDPHVPVSRVNESAEILKELNADVTLKIYKGRQHTISGEELALANTILKN